MKKIIHAFNVDASTDKVFEAITSQKGLSGWWTTQVQAESRKGGKIHFTFIEVFNPIMEIVELEPGEKVVWKCIAGHDNWQDNTFAFELSKKDGGTWLRFSQDYARELDDDTYGQYNFNWGYYLNSLKKLCETGQGEPFQVSR